jgi:hypothetical protein
VSIPGGAALSTVLLIMRLAPEVRDAVESFVRALLKRDEDAARRAVEAALRAAFVARQRR